MSVLGCVGFGVGLALVAGCAPQEPTVTGTQSLKIDLVSPTAGGGSDMTPLPDTDRTVVVNVTALNAEGATDTTFNNDLQVYVQYLGTLTPALDAPPLTTVHMTAGVAMNQTIMLPAVFGPTTIWFSDDLDTNPTYATGSSPALFFRQPFIRDIQEPTNEQSPDALDQSPLQNKTVSVGPTVPADVGGVFSSRNGANGRLVVTSIFAQGYTVADVLCQDANGTPPCTAGEYDYLEVFSFSAPQDQNTDYLAEGQTVDGFAGGVSEFDGLTELGFPQTFVFSTTPDINKAREPAAALLNPVTWFLPQSDGTGGILNFERNEAGLIEIDNAKVCDNVATSPDYITYKQWDIDPKGVGGDCSSNKNIISVVTEGTLSVDPTTLSGMTLPKIFGILRPINIGSFNVWIIYPRSDADLTLP